MADKPKRANGPEYRRPHLIPIRYWKWVCPECGDISEDPINIHDTMCHNGHTVKICVVEGIYSDYVVSELVPG